MDIKQLLQINVKKLHPNAVIPSYAKSGDAGLDLTATSIENKNGRICYGTGIAIEIPEGYVGLIFPRSSISKYDLRLSNCVGVIDSGYRGEIKLMFENDSMEPRSKMSDALKAALSHSVFKNMTHMRRVYKVGDRIGQLIIMPYSEIQIQEVKKLSDSDRGDGGFGSSGK